MVDGGLRYNNGLDLFRTASTRIHIKGSLQASVTVRKCGVITKYTEICIAGNPLNFNFKDTHQFTAAPLDNEAMAANIAGKISVAI